jgi:hypothetical protein
MALAALVPFLGPITSIIDKFVMDPEEKLKIRAELLTQMSNQKSELYKQSGEIIVAEAKGESPLQRLWRPITMLAFVFIIVNNYVLVPYISWLSVVFNSDLPPIPSLDIPEGMWQLLSYGIAGYVGSRGIEKVVDSVQRGGVPLISRDKGLTAEDLREDREHLLRELKNIN